MIYLCGGWIEQSLQRMCAWQQGGLLQKFQELSFIVDDLPIGKGTAEDLRFQLSFYYSPSSTYNLTDADLNIEGLQV